jgi:uncharacterized membrane protein YkvA (DUF1232 family)
VDGEVLNPTKVSGLCSPAEECELVRIGEGSITGWKQHAKQLRKEAHVFYFAFKHPRMHWYARLVAACVAGYLLSPIQLIPSFMPVIGFLDDFLVVFLGVKLLRRLTHPDVLTECRQLADAAEIQRRERTRSSSAVVAAVVIVTLWLFVAMSASALMVAYIRHK